MTTTTLPSIDDILTETRRLFLEVGWTQHHMAETLVRPADERDVIIHRVLDAHGTPTDRYICDPEDAEACAFCFLGGLERAFLNLTGRIYSDSPVEFQVRYTETLDLVAGALFREIREPMANHHAVEIITRWNDDERRRVADPVRLLDQLLADRRVA